MTHNRLARDSCLYHTWFAQSRYKPAYSRQDHCTQSGDVAKSLTWIVAVQQVSLPVVAEVDNPLHSTVREDETTVESLRSPGTWLDDPDTAVPHLLLQGEIQKYSIRPDPCCTAVVAVVLVVDDQDTGG